MKLAWILLFAFVVYLLSDPVDSIRLRRFRARRVFRSVTRSVSSAVRRVVGHARRLASRVARIATKYVIPHTLHPVFKLSQLVMKIPLFKSDAKIQDDPSSVMETCPGICLIRCPSYMDWDTTCEWLCTNLCQLFDGEEKLKDPLPFSGGIRVIPCEFSEYDKNEDGSLDARELARPTRAWEDTDNNIWFFDKLDTDDNGLVSKDEFNAQALFCEDE